MFTELITWNPVPETRPDAETNVLLLLAEGGSCEGFYDDSGPEPVWRDVCASEVPAAVTHWAEMPNGGRA